MEINEQLIEYLEELSRLRLNDHEKEVATKDLHSILGHCNMLNGLNTDGIEGISNPYDNVNALREDVVIPSLPREKLLQNAPVQKDGTFVVPKTVE